MATVDTSHRLALAIGSVLVAVLIGTGCVPAQQLDQRTAPAASASATPVAADPNGATPSRANAGLDPDVVADPDPYDGVIGEVTLTPAQVTYRDALDLTDAEAHDAFRYSCAIPTVPNNFVRYANVPPTTEESP
jgi:hypothetical protein